LGVWATDTANVTGLGQPEQVRTVLVSDGVLQALRVPPALGRWISQPDQNPHGPKAVMLSYGYWQRQFGGDPSVIGRHITVDAQSREIVGVMPRGFRVVNADFDLIVPLAFDRSKLVLAGFGYNGIARLKPGVTIAQADTDLARMVPIWMDFWSNGPGTNSHFYTHWRITPAIRLLKQQVVGNIGSVLWIVMGTLGIVMLIACANVANLLLVKADGRQQELAIRAALGAGRWRIARELLLESVLLGLAGGALGVGLAYAGLQLLKAIGPANLPRLSEISLDGRALVFTLILSLLSGLLFGLIPALKHAGPRIAVALRSAGRSMSASRELHRSRNCLVVMQIAMALVLLVSAGLMIRTFQALRTVEPGFTDARHIQTVQISIPVSLVAQPEQVTRIQNNILDKLAAIPGVTSVGFASDMPLEGIEPNWDLVYAEGKDYGGKTPPLRALQNVSPGFFHAMGTRIVAGRDLTWTDVYGLRPVAIISENLARELWGTPLAALGKRFSVSGKSTQLHEVVGVVQNVRENGVQETAPETVYWPSMMKGLYGSHSVTSDRTVAFAIRSNRAGTASFLNEIRKAVWSVNRSLPVASARTMQDIFDQSTARTSFTLVMLGIAGAMAFVLGIVGIYGVISYAVSQRRHEIGIRLALGAPQANVRRMFVRSGLSLAGIGVAIGLVTAIAVTGLMKSLLFGISSLDPVTYAGASLVLTAATVVASYLPARRAAALDPVEVLKAE
ncbi:MAG: ABC transporter permease, partial [Bryobacteraceae bacterium]